MVALLWFLLPVGVFLIVGTVCIVMMWYMSRMGGCWQQWRRTMGNQESENCFRTMCRDWKSKDSDKNFPYCRWMKDEER